MLRYALLFAAAAALFWQLMLPPVVGVADNGDFSKMLGRFSLGSVQTFTYVNAKLPHGSKYYWDSPFRSSELLPVASAVTVNRLFSRDGSLDLRFIGAVHALLFLLAAFLLRGMVNSVVVGVAAVLLFCDFMYTGFYNSFYMDTAAHIFGVLAAVFYIRAVQRRTRVDAAALLVSMMLALAAAPHYAVMGLWFAILFWAARDVLCDGRKAVAAAACAVILLASWGSYRRLFPESYAAIDPFDVIFYEILPNSPNPDQALNELGLDSSYRPWIGLVAYSQGVPMDDPAYYKPFLARTSFVKIGLYYLRHPGSGWRALCAALGEAGRFQSPLGNFDSDSGKPPAAHYHGFQLASGLKRQLFYHHGARLFASLVALALLTPALVYRKRSQLPAGTLAGTLALAGMALMMLGVSALGDAVDQYRHLFVAFGQFDMLLLTLIWIALPNPVSTFAIPAPAGSTQSGRTSDR